MSERLMRAITGHTPYEAGVAFALSVRYAAADDRPAAAVLFLTGCVSILAAVICRKVGAFCREDDDERT